jgi:Spy/CpxP family protein refolding chaperone
MKRTSRLVLAAAILATGLTSSAAWSFSRHGGGHRFERAIERLDLDADTQARVDALFDAARPAQRELARSLREQGEELRELMKDPAATEEAVVAKVDAISKLSAEMRKQEIRTAFQVRALLTPEQRQQLAEKMDKRGGHRGDKCEGRH